MRSPKQVTIIPGDIKISEAAENGSPVLLGVAPVPEATPVAVGFIEEVFVTLNQPPASTVNPAACMALCALNGSLV
jgi:hypothetical protein